MKYLCALWICIFSVFVYAENELTVTPGTFTLVPKKTQKYAESDKSVTFEVTDGKTKVECKNLKVPSFNPETVGKWKMADSYNKDNCTLSAPDELDTDIKSRAFEITFTLEGTGGAANKTGKSTITIATEKKLTVTPDTFTLVPKKTQTYLASDKSVTFEVSDGNSKIKCDDLDSVTFKPEQIGKWKIADSFDKKACTLSAPDDLDEGIELVQFDVIFNAKGDQGAADNTKAKAAAGDQNAQGAAANKADQGTPGKMGKATITVAKEKNNEWESRAIAGYHQAGGSSVDMQQNFFLDFFIMRGLGNGERVYQNAFNLWGNVRIASTPQQTTTGETKLAEFAGDFSGKFGSLKLNELAQSAEFQVGLERRLKVFTQGNRKRMLGLIVFGGASGFIGQPKIDYKVLVVPAAGDQQDAEFKRRYPAVNASYVAFVPPDRERFYRFYGAGIRMTTFELDKPYAPPATWTLTLGQDETITGGRLGGLVSRIDVFYPLPIGREDGRYKFIFLFGTANLRLAKDKQATPLYLKQAMENSAAIPLTDPRVAIVTSPSTRDTYRIGAGVDFVNLIRSWKKVSKP